MNHFVYTDVQGGCSAFTPLDGYRNLPLYWQLYSPQLRLELSVYIGNSVLTTAKPGTVSLYWELYSPQLSQELSVYTGKSILTTVKPGTVSLYWELYSPQLSQELSVYTANSVLTTAKPGTVSLFWEQYVRAVFQSNLLIRSGAYGVRRFLLLFIWFSTLVNLPL